MKNSRMLKLAGALLGATIMTSTAAIASGSNGKCGAGTCGDKNSTKEVKQKNVSDSKCGTGTCGATKKKMKKDMKKAGDSKCGTGTCGSTKKAK